MCFGKTLLWLQLSNSGNTLKLKVPSYSRKAICGQNNSLGTVISLKINESEMGYRGSKSEYNSLYEINSVKEQRVDGSYCIKATTKLMQLRCTLMGFERYYQVKIPSKQLNINKSFFSTVSAIEGQTALNPYFITGFSDAESSFSVTIYKNKKLTTGYRVRPFFVIGLNERDSLLLTQIQEFFGKIGTMRKDKTANAVKYSVDNIKDLTTVIIPHFKKYPLITQKAADFKLFEQIVELMNKGAHRTFEGLQQIINIKASLNLGISDIIKSEFSETKPVKRDTILTKNIPVRKRLIGLQALSQGMGVLTLKSLNSKQII